MKIFLTGFMAAGKTTLGAQLAKEFGLDFVDLDQCIEKEQNLSIEKLFEERGERHFRKIEEQTLYRLTKQDNMVCALGGGTLENLAASKRLKSVGRVVFIDTPIQTCISRIRTEGSRPLGDQSDDQLKSLYQKRLAGYRNSHVSFVNEGQSVEKSGSRLVRFLDSIKSISHLALGQSCFVDTKQKHTPILFKSGSLHTMGENLRTYFPKRKKLQIISDSNVSALFGKDLYAQFKRHGFEVKQAKFPAGETSKSLSEFEKLIGQIQSQGVERDTLVVNFGGGVTSDLGGFVAATLLRGLEHVHIPTTLLAMVDASIGGKVGINTEFGKNLLGAFWHPALILADPNVLGTLPMREVKCGLGEMLKTVLLLGEGEFSSFVELAKQKDVSKILESDLIFECIKFKAQVVTKDENEQGLRKILNLGHTLGHAIEKEQGYKGMSHGEAVALGCLAACRVSKSLGFADESLEQRVREALQFLGMEVDLRPWLNEKTLGHVIYDKKLKDGKIDFVAIGKPGEVKIIRLSPQELQRILCNG